MQAKGESKTGGPAGAMRRAEGGDAAARQPIIRGVRASDVEPYTGLGYLSKLFRVIAVFLILLIVLEAGSGFYQQGAEALPTLLSEASRLLVLAAALWGGGDLATLLIDVGHDVRATRILLARLVAQTSGGRGAEREENSAEDGAIAS